MLSTKTKGQTTLEVVILIGFVTAALVAMGVYIKRGIQGRLRGSTDQVGEQYSAWKTSGSYTTTNKVDQYDKMLGKGATSTSWDDPNKNYQTKQGQETINDLASEPTTYPK